MKAFVRVVVGWMFVALGSAAGAQSLQVKVLTQSPAETKTELQVICLFRSAPENTLHGSLVEIDEKLHGALSRVRTQGFFGGELGETVVFAPAHGELGAKRLLVIGLGDSATFSPDRMYLVGKIAFREANRLGVAHPIFAATVLDGGVTKFATGAIAEQVVRGLMSGSATEKVMDGVALPVSVVDFAVLAGVKFAEDTRQGVARGLAITP